MSAHLRQAFPLLKQPLVEMNDIMDRVIAGQPLKKWCDELGSATREVRLNAAIVIHDAFEKQGDFFGPAIGHFIGLIDHPDLEVADTIIRAIGFLGPGAKDAAPALVRAAQRNADEEVRIHALESLVRLEEYDAAMPFLLQILGDPRDEYCCNAENLISEIGARARGGVPLLIKNLNTPDMNVSMGARFALRKVLGSEAIPVFVRGLAHKSAIVRKECIEGLGLFGPVAEGALSPLLHILGNDKSPGVRVEAAQAVGRICWKSGNIPNELLKALSDKDGKVRIRASGAVALIDAGHMQAMSILIAGLDDTADDNRTAAVYEMGEVATPQIDVSVIKKLIGLFKDPDCVITTCAERALVRVGARAIPALLQSIDSGEGQSRNCACLTIGSMGSSARSAIPALVKRLRREKDEDGFVLAALSQIVGEGDGEVVPVLVKYAGAEEPYLRKSAIQGLARIGAKGREVIDLVEKSLTDEDEEVREAAQEFIARLDTSG